MQPSIKTTNLNEETDSGKEAKDEPNKPARLSFSFLVLTAPPESLMAPAWYSSAYLEILP